MGIKNWLRGFWGSKTSNAKVAPEEKSNETLLDLKELKQYYDNKVVLNYSTIDRRIMKDLSELDIAKLALIEYIAEVGFGRDMEKFGNNEDYIVDKDDGKGWKTSAHVQDVLMNAYLINKQIEKEGLLYNENGTPFYIRRSNYKTRPSYDSYLQTKADYLKYMKSFNPGLNKNEMPEKQTTGSFFGLFGRRSKLHDIIYKLFQQTLPKAKIEKKM